MEFKEVKDVEFIGKHVVDGAVKVHKALGPGLLESVYQECLTIELRKRGFDVQCEEAVPVVYEGHRIEVGYRLDMRVNGVVIVENKAVEALLPVHTAQLLTYLRLCDCQLGYLINWNVELIKDGIQRKIHNYYPPIHFKSPSCPPSRP
jgi:GxxExxY protein